MNSKDAIYFYAIKPKDLNSYRESDNFYHKWVLLEEITKNIVDLHDTKNIKKIKEYLKKEENKTQENNNSFTIYDSKVGSSELKAEIIINADELIIYYHNSVNDIKMTSVFLKNISRKNKVVLH